MLIPQLTINLQIWLGNALFSKEDNLILCYKV